MKNAILWIASLLLLPPQILAKAELQRAFVVWDKSCIHSVGPSEKMRMEAPMVDGKPDLANAKVYGLAVDYDFGCGRIEIRRVK
jgi:hypothetical protein